MSNVRLIFGALAASAALVVGVFVLTRVAAPTTLPDPSPTIADASPVPPEVLPEPAPSPGTSEYDGIVLYVDGVETTSSEVFLSSLATTSLEVFVVGAGSDGVCSARLEGSGFTDMFSSPCGLHSAQWSLPALAPGYYMLSVDYLSIEQEVLVERYELIVG